MLTQLSTLKARLVIPDTDTQFDALLTSAIAAVSARFDKECRRTLARTVAAVQEFDPADTELCVACYPIESVSKFELKTSEAAGWQEIAPTPDYLVRHSCIISLPCPPSLQSSVLCPPSSALCRLTYTGGYVLPGVEPGPGQTPLPADLEQAAVEQLVFWFTNRDRVGVIREWPKGGLYQQFADIDLLPSVRAVLAHHQRVG